MGSYSYVETMYGVVLLCGDYVWGRTPMWRLCMGSYSYVECAEHVTGRHHLLYVECHLISISNLILIGLFSTERGKRNLEN